MKRKGKFPMHFPIILVVVTFLTHTMKGSIVIMKKFDFEILIYLNVLRSLEFIYAIFTVCVSVCVCVSEYDSV